MTVSPSARNGLTLQQLLTAILWLALVLSGTVIYEPAPYDLLLIVLIFAMPMAGMLSLDRSLVALLVLWLLIASGGILASLAWEQSSISLKHILVTVFLSLTSVLFAAYVRVEPAKRVKLIYSGYVIAAVASALLMLCGYFGLVPGGLADILQLYGRPKALFKDPNVVGAFLVPATLYLINSVITGRVGWILPKLMAIAVLAMGLLLSFSRGAWGNFAVSFIIWGYLLFVASKSARLQRRLVVAGFIGIVLFAGAVFVVSQSQRLESQLSDRASIMQNYDTDRFEAQHRALILAMEHPLGIGARSFAYMGNDTLDVHNVYLSMFLNSGWLGGFLFIYLIVLTLIRGLAASLKTSAFQNLLIVTYASYVAVILESVIIDSDHWRHLFLIIGLLWGMMSAVSVKQPNAG